MVLKVVDRYESWILLSFSCRCAIQHRSEAVEATVDHQCTLAVVSLGSRDMNTSVLNRAIDYAASQGVALIAAAGNEGPSRG